MSRNSSGTYTLPSGNPVVSGTLIEATWANDTLSDLATAMTGSLSRSAEGGMLAALRLYDGTSSVPGLAWGSETTSGWYRAGAGDMRLVITGSQVMQYLATGVAITGTLSVSGNTTLSGGTANGVAYLNGSKVLTTGSALTFDGTNLGVGLTPAGSFRLEIGGADGTQFAMRSTGTTSARIRAYVNSAESGVIGFLNGGGQFFEVAGSEQMRLTSTGLGIGTSSPASKLVVKVQTNGNAEFRTTDAIFGTITGGVAIDSLNDARNAIVPFGLRGNGVYINDGTGTSTFSGGNLGLGVTPSAWSSQTAIELPRGVSFSASTTGNISWNLASNAVGLTNWTYKNTAPAVLYQGNNGQHIWYNAPSGTAGNSIPWTQAMTLDASGNLGIGTSSPGYPLDVVGSNATGVGIRAKNNNGSTSSALLFAAGSGYAAYGVTAYDAWLTAETAGQNVTVGPIGAGAVKFVNNGSERMRIDSSGNLLVGTTSYGSPSGSSVSISPSDGRIWTGHASGAASGSSYEAFNYAGSVIGSITQNGTTGVLYNITSDARLKQNVAPAADAGALIDAIDIVQFDWKSDGSHQPYGVLAQNVQTVAPYAVKEGDSGQTVTDPWAVDYSKLVPMLVKEIQSLRARVTQLEGA